MEAVDFNSITGFYSNLGSKEMGNYCPFSANIGLRLTTFNPSNNSKLLFRENIVISLYFVPLLPNLLVIGK